MIRFHQKLLFAKAHPVPNLSTLFTGEPPTVKQQGVLVAGALISVVCMFTSLL